MRYCYGTQLVHTLCGLVEYRVTAAVTKLTENADELSSQLPDTSYDTQYS